MLQVRTHGLADISTTIREGWYAFEDEQLAITMALNYNSDCAIHTLSCREEKIVSCTTLDVVDIAIGRKHNYLFKVSSMQV
jgi:hypothetical protein